MTEAGAGTDCGTHENVGREGGGWVEDRGGRESVCQSGRPGGAGPGDHQLI